MRKGRFTFKSLFQASFHVELVRTLSGISIHGMPHNGITDTSCFLFCYHGITFRNVPRASFYQQVDISRVHIEFVGKTNCHFVARASSP